MTSTAMKHGVLDMAVLVVDEMPHTLLQIQLLEQALQQLTQQPLVDLQQRHFLVEFELLG